jgi:hypothetical protein
VDRQVLWSGSAVGRGVWSRRQSAPSDASQPQHCRPPSIRAVLPALRSPTTVLVSSRSSIDASDTTLPLLLSTMRAPFRCLFMHAQLHHPFCTTGLRTTAPTARHTQCKQLQLAHRLGMLAACARRWEGKRAGGHLQYRTADTWMRVCGARRGCLS